jgi:hypothetical protein
MPSVGQTDSVTTISHLAADLRARDASPVEVGVLDAPLDIRGEDYRRFSNVSAAYVRLAEMGIHADGYFEPLVPRFYYEHSVLPPATRQRYVIGPVQTTPQVPGTWTLQSEAGDWGVLVNTQAVGTAWQISSGAAEPLPKVVVEPTRVAVQADGAPRGRL